MTTELHGRYSKPRLVKLVNAKVGAEATKAYSSSAITDKLFGCYDDQYTRSFFSPKL